MPGLAKRLGWALGVSLGIHLALLFGPHLSLPDSFAPAATLEARIEPLPPPKPQPTRRPPKPKHTPPPATPAPIPSATPSTEKTAAIPASEAPQAAPRFEMPPMPKQARISYVLYKGLNKLAVGKVTHAWQTDGNHYAVSSIAEASGVFSLFYSGRHLQESRGDITPDGLRPTSFRTERGRSDPDKTDSAQFDWSAMTLALKSGSDSSTVELPVGTQDLLSFLYQFAYAPPEEGLRLFITNGRKLDAYSYQPVGDETLDTPLGPLKTLHIRRGHKSGEDETDIWLATDYHYLPVKIRLTDKNGDAAEQVVSDLRLTDQK